MSTFWKPMMKPPPRKSVSGFSNLASKINEVLKCNSVANQCNIYASTDEPSDRICDQLNFNGFSNLNNVSESLLYPEEDRNDFEVAQNLNIVSSSSSDESEPDSKIFFEPLQKESDHFETEKKTNSPRFDFQVFQVESPAWGSPPTATRSSPMETDLSKKINNELFLNNYFKIVKKLTQNTDPSKSSTQTLNAEVSNPYFKILKSKKPETNSEAKTSSESNIKRISKYLRTCHNPLENKKKSDSNQKKTLNSSKLFSLESKRSKKYKQLKMDYFLTKSSAMMSSNSSFEESIMLRGSLTMTSTTEAVSPVTLSSDWSRVARLLLLTALSVTGSVGNVFMISAVMIEDHLKKRGNSFIVNIALADILITGLVIPASTVVILADLSDAKVVVCNFQWFLALVSCLVSILTISATAMENYARLCMPSDCYSTLTPCKITVIIILIWLTSCTAVTTQTVLRLGPDYCERTSQGLLPYQITIGVLFVLIPAAMACVCFSLITFRVRTFKSIPTFRPPMTFNFDYELMKTNMYGFVFFLLFWLPFGMTLAFGSQTISQRVFYSLAWLALSKSCFLNLLYCITNRHFRNAYINLFHYCCCKTTVSFSRRSREPIRPTGDVRVHIIPGYNMYSYTSPQRSREVTKTTCKRLGTSTSCRPALSRPNGRDVYEL